MYTIYVGIDYIFSYILILSTTYMLEFFKFHQFSVIVYTYIVYTNALRIKLVKFDHLHIQV